MNDASAVEAFRRSVRVFLRDHIAPGVEQWERDGGWPVRDLLPEFGKRHLLGLTFDRRHGGAGLDFRYARVLGEELGSLDCGGVGMSVVTHTDMSTPALASHGSAEAAQEFLVPAVAGTAVGAIALTEPGGGSDFAAIGTRLVADGSDYLVSGRKSYITNGSVADFHVTLCRSYDDRSVAEALTLVVIPAAAPGVSATPYRDKLGYWSCDHAEVTFDRVRVPAAYVIGGIGLGYPIEAEQLIRERLMSAIMWTAQARRLLARACERATEQRTFGARLLDHDAIGGRLADIDATVTLLDAHLDRCVAAVTGSGAVSKLALVAKLVAGRAWAAAADCALQVFGGGGYLREVGLQRAYRDSRATALAGGSEETLRRSLVGHLAPSGPAGRERVTIA